MNTFSPCPLNFDSLVMLTWSNWATELRSNRYHYASRFSKKCPVIFVQPDLDTMDFRFEKTEIPNVTVLHLYQQYNEKQLELFNLALIEAKVRKPIFWIYNGYFQNIVCNSYSVLNVFHGTEDYFASKSHIKITDDRLLYSFNQVLKRSNLLVSVSEGVKNSFIEHSSFMGEIITVTNGCDYKFYAPLSINNCLPDSSENIAFYQGNIFDKLDYDLLIALAKRMPTWSFQFCGKIVFNEKSWQTLCKLPNVTYLGLLTPEEIRSASYKATVGLIPFVESEWLIERSFPLKSFEYLACGLPVVSVPIKALLPYDEVIEFASGVFQFEKALSHAALLKKDRVHFQKRLDAAALQDYDLKFQIVENKIQETINQLKSNIDAGLHRYNVLVLYRPETNKVNSLLSALTFFSIHSIAYCPVLEQMQGEVDLKVFDALVVDGSLVYRDKMIVPNQLIEKIRVFGGYKILATSTPDYSIYCPTLGIHQFCIFPFLGYGKEVEFSNSVSKEDRKIIDEFDLLISTALCAGLPLKKIIYSMAGYQKEEENCRYNRPPSHFCSVPSNIVYSIESMNNRPITIENRWTIRQLFSAIFDLQRQYLFKALLDVYQNRLFALKKIINVILPERFKPHLRQWFARWARR